jgi:hypothetical protein
MLLGAKLRKVLRPALRRSSFFSTSLNV